jgi:hypothetical protein
MRPHDVSLGTPAGHVRRVGALALDLAILGSGGAAAAGLVFGAVGLIDLARQGRQTDVSAARHVWNRGSEQVKRWGSSTLPFAIPQQTEPVAVAIIGLATRNWRDPGSRLMRIRRVSTRDGGPVTTGQSVIMSLLDLATTHALRRAFKPLTIRGDAVRREGSDRLRDLAPQLEELDQTYRDRPELREVKKYEFYREHQISPFSPLLWRLLAITARAAVPYVFTKPGQHTFERIAEVIWINDSAAAAE